jgi:hypothetical protein
MIETSLAFLGKHLAGNFECDHKHVKFTSKDTIFRKLSEEGLSLEMPVIAYHMTNIEPISTKMSRRTGSMVSSVNSDYTLFDSFNPQMVDVTISCGFVTNSKDSYFKMIRRYFNLIKNAEIAPVITVDGKQLEVKLSLSDFASLSQIPEGKEGYDYDRGNFYTFETEFRLKSYILFDSIGDKLIRDIAVSWEI